MVSAQGAVLQNDIIYHICNFVAFCWLVPFAVCIWWLYIHLFAKMLSRFAFFSYFYKNVLPARAGSTFLKANSEQSAFKHPLFGALKAWDKDSLGHLLDIYRSFARSVRLLSASVAHHNFDSRSWLVHFGPLKPDPQHDNTYHTCNFVNFWWLMPFAVCFWWLHTHLIAKCILCLHFFHIFTKICFPLERGAHFCKKYEKIANWDNIFAKNVCIAIKSRQQKAPAIKKLQNCKCDKWCCFAGWLHVQIPHVLPTIFQNSDGRLKRKRGEKKKVWEP